MSLGTATDGNSVTVSGTDAGSASAAPATFAEAFAADASSASDTPDQALDATAAAQPATDSGSPQQTDDRSPFIPRARFDEVITKKSELESKLQQLAWAEQVTPQEFQSIQQIARHFAGGDQLAGIKALIAEARKDPTIEAQLRSEAARILSQRTQQAAEDAEPQFMVPQQDGSIAFDPNALAQWKQWFARQITGQVQQEIQPLKQSYEQQQAAAKQAQVESAWNTWQGQIVADTATWPGMDNPDVRQKFSQDVWRQIQGHDITLTDTDKIERAIERSYRTVVVPTLSQSAEARTLDTLQRKAAASKTVNPGSAGASTPKPITSFHQLGPEAWR